MNNRNSTSKRKELIIDNTKTRKKYEKKYKKKYGKKIKY
jgi:hypothetical protein